MPKQKKVLQTKFAKTQPNHKKVFVSILLVLSIVLVTLPFLVSFNEVLTRLVEKNFLYLWVQDNIVPFEAKMMGVLLIPFGYHYAFAPTNSTIVVNGISMGITWNCLGWQSFLLLFVSLIVGFRGKYKKISIMEALGIGILGTFWLNIARMILTILLAVHAPPVFRIVFHDYLAAGTTVVWLFAFWWFSYSFILVRKENLYIPQNSRQSYYINHRLFR